MGATREKYALIVAGDYKTLLVLKVVLNIGVAFFYQYPLVCARKLIVPFLDCKKQKLAVYF